MPVLVLFLGLGVDVGSLRLAKRRLQTAADSAATASGLEIRQCGLLGNCAAMQNAATSAMQENGYSGITLSSNCTSMAAASGVKVTINSPPCALGASDPNYGKTTAVEVVVSGFAPLTFGRILGLNQLPIMARAEAARPMSPPCIYALDPHASGAVSITAGVLMNFTCGIVDESDSSSALTCLVGLGITAPSVKVTGGAAGLLCGVSNLKQNVPRPTPADPLAYLPQPAVGTCGIKSGNTFNGSATTANIVLGGTYTFNPGVYCGGISISAVIGANITFNPGVYILKDGTGTLGLPTGGLNMSVGLLSSIQGSGVTFYNTGTLGGFTVLASTPLGLSTFALSAPTSGTYGGILFYQDPASTMPANITGSLLTGSKMEGALYLPNASLTYGVSALSSSYNIVVAKNVNFAVAVATTIGADYSALSSGSPINGNLAWLTQ